jgi:hypothetical protein
MPNLISKNFRVQVDDLENVKNLKECFHHQLALYLNQFLNSLIKKSVIKAEFSSRV